MNIWHIVHIFMLMMGAWVGFGSGITLIWALLGWFYNRRV